MVTVNIILLAFLSSVSGEAPERARHSGHGVLGEHQHDTSESIQDILNVLGKQGNLSFSCETEGTFPHPLDCSKYYLCEDEQQEAKEFDCLYEQTGLFFNKETGHCDWAEKTVCFSEDNGDIAAVEAEVEFDCETPGTFPDPEFCMKFIRCNKKLFANLEYCSTGTFYDIRARKCLWASQVDCGTRQQLDLGGSEDDLVRRYGTDDIIRRYNLLQL